MLRAKLIAAALSAAVALPVAAFAQTGPEITMLGKGYFPNKANIAEGTSVTFHNAGLMPMAATALDDSWTTGWVFPGERVTVVLPAEGGRVYNNRVSALDPLLGAEPEVINEAMFVSKAADDLLDVDATPLDDDTVIALYGSGSFDTDGDGDADGHDWSEILVDPEDRPWAVESTDGTTTTESDVPTASN